MQTNNKMLDDLAKLGLSAAGTLHGVKSEIEALIRQRLEGLMAEMDLVSREDYEVVREMAVQAREKNDELEARIAVLKAQLSKEEK